MVVVICGVVVLVSIVFIVVFYGYTVSGWCLTTTWGGSASRNIPRVGGWWGDWLWAQLLSGMCLHLGFLSLLVCLSVLVCLEWLTLLSLGWGLVLDLLWLLLSSCWLPEYWGCDGHFPLLCQPSGGLTVPNCKCAHIGCIHDIWCVDNQTRDDLFVHSLNSLDLVYGSQ